jgi:hypothetical protein
VDVFSFVRIIRHGGIPESRRITNAIGDSRFRATRLTCGVETDQTISCVMPQD